MARRTAEALAVAEPPVASNRSTPHEQARRALADAITAALGRQDVLNALAERLEHGETILARGMDDHASAERLVMEAKRQALFNGGADWRDATGITEAQAVLIDAGERMELARDAIAQIQAERAEVERQAAGDHARIEAATSAVVRSSPRVAALVAEATEKRRAWREIELVLDAVRSHFPGELPGWQPVRIFDTPPTRDHDWRTSLELLRTNPDTEFPP